MSLSQSLLSDQLLLAFTLYLAAILFSELATARLEKRLEVADAPLWPSERLLYPLLRAASLVVFITAAYPVIFGSADLPPLLGVLGTESGRLGTLINLSLLLALLLPLLLRARSLVLPLQGIVLTALLFHWLAGAVELDNYTLWPSLEISIAIVLLSLSAHYGATALTHQLAARLETHTGRDGLAPLLFDSLLLIFQSPALLLYGISLGEQL